MNKALKYITNLTLKPALKLYLSRNRKYTHNGIRLIIPPQVFHPAFFFSSKFLLQYILKQDLQNKTFLELGAGSGLISFSAAKKGAIVTASDINKTAIEYLEKNNAANKLNINILESDLFDNIPVQHFDIIAINPPYYKKNPSSDADHAWYCGENGEYFSRLFQTLKSFTNPNSEVLMVLCDDCDMDMIKQAAHQYQFQLSLAEQTRKLSEMNYIFRVVPTA